jgi:4a-hydroxytetrahydrobiopterin dehydratase
MALIAGTITSMTSWKETSDTLVKEFLFANFAEALAFVNKVGNVAEQQQHHPDIELSWGKVIVRLTTHDKGHVTDKDRTLARAIDAL